MGTISTIQSVSKRLLKVGGYEFEPRSFGEGKVTLWRRQIGKKPASGQVRRLVVIPGFGDTPMSWMPTVTALPRLKSFQKLKINEIVLLEFSGYIGSLGSASEPQVAIDTVSGVVAAVSEILDDLGPSVLVGHSMGGFLAANYVATHSSSRLDKLILLCPSGMNPGNESERNWNRLVDEIIRGNAAPFINSAVGRLPAHRLLRFPYKILEGEFHEFLRRKESISILTSAQKEHEMKHRAATIAVPTVLVWGEKDPLIPLDAFDLWRAELQSGQCNRFQAITLPDATHALHIEAPLAIARAIVSE